MLYFFQETIPSMMNALRMVWIISRHYNKDERMVPMMQLIAIEIAEKVCGACQQPFLRSGCGNYCVFLIACCPGFALTLTLFWFRNKCVAQLPELSVLQCSAAPCRVREECVCVCVRGFLDSTLIFWNLTFYCVMFPAEINDLVFFQCDLCHAFT